MYQNPKIKITDIGVCSSAGNIWENLYPICQKHLTIPKQSKYLQNMTHGRPQDPILISAVVEEALSFEEKLIRLIQPALLKIYQYAQTPLKIMFLLPKHYFASRQKTHCDLLGRYLLSQIINQSSVDVCCLNGAINLKRILNTVSQVFVLKENLSIILLAADSLINPITQRKLQAKSLLQTPSNPEGYALGEACVYLLLNHTKHPSPAITELEFSTQAQLLNKLKLNLNQLPKENSQSNLLLLSNYSELKFLFEIIQFQRQLLARCSFQTLNIAKTFGEVGIVSSLLMMAISCSAVLTSKMRMPIVNFPTNSLEEVLIIHPSHSNK